MRTNLADLIFSLRKKEACFLISWKKGAPPFPVLLLPILFLLKIDMVEDRERKPEHKS